MKLLILKNHLIGVDTEVVKTSFNFKEDFVLRRDFKNECLETGWEFIEFVGENRRVLFKYDGDLYISNRAKFPPVLLSLKNAYDKTEWLKNYLNKKHTGKGYDFSNLEYNGYFGELKGFCDKHGLFYIKANKIHESKGCKECGKLNMGAYLKPKDFKNELSKVHNFKYDYSKFIYTNNITPSVIICPEHGEFLQTFASHKRGSECPSCAEHKRRNNSKVSFDKFLKRSIEKHGYFYDYSKVKSLWNGTKDTYEIVCPEHGVFRQQAYSHTKGRGCSKCNGDGWSRSSYIDMANKKNNGLIKLYLINLYDEYESFYKIGLTIKSLKERVSGIGGYSFNEIYSFDLPAALAYDLERLLINEFSESSYLPNREFGGRTECFSFVNKNEFVKLVKTVA